MSVSQLAGVLGLSEISIRQNLLPLLDDASIDSSGRGKKYLAPDVIRAYLKREIARPNRQKDDDDPLLRGANSPAQERYRAAKADLAEMERDRIRGILVPLTDVHEACARFAGRVRLAAEMMCEPCRLLITRSLGAEEHLVGPGGKSGGDAVPAGDSSASAEPT